MDRFIAAVTATTRLGGPGRWWRLDGFLDRDDRLSADQRLALLGWILELQDDPLPPPAVEVTDARGRSIRVGLLDPAGWP